MNENSRVVAVLGSYPLQPNIQSVLFNLGRLLRGKFSFHLLMGPEPLPDQLRGLYTAFQFDVPPVKSDNVGFAFKAVKSYLGRNRPQAIVNASQPFPLGAAVVIFGSWYGVPTILRVTGDYFEESNFGNRWSRLKQEFIHGRVLNYVYRQSDFAVPVGSRLAHKLLQHGFSSDQVKLLPQPFDPEPFSPTDKPEKRSLKKGLGLDPDRKIILNVGRLSWGKGADRVFEIAEAVQEKTDGVYQFCLVGDGEYKNEFRNRFAREDVYCAGFVARQNVHKYYRIADLLIHPTRRDALPNVILEALAAEVPVMAAPVGEIGNLVTMVSDDPDEYVRKILRGHWTLDELPEPLDSWEKQAKRYEALFSEAVNCE